MKFENLLALDSPHQPVLICLDTSDSMNEDAGNGTSKIKMVENIINQLANIEFSEWDKYTIDICILGFNDTVYTILDWQPLIEFKGDIKLSTKGNTALNSVILESIRKVREMRKVYNEASVYCRRAMIFVYTDGFSSEDMQPAYQKSQSYFNRDNPPPSSKLYIALTPTYNNGQLIKFENENICTEFKQLVDGLGNHVTFFNADNSTSKMTTLIIDDIYTTDMESEAMPLEEYVHLSKLNFSSACISLTDANRGKFV